MANDGELGSMDVDALLEWDQLTDVGDVGSCHVTTDGDGTGTSSVECRNVGSVTQTGLTDVLSSCHVAAGGSTSFSKRRVLGVAAARRKKRLILSPRNWRSRYMSACQLLDTVVAAVPKNRREKYSKMIQYLKDGKGKLQVVYLP